MVSSTENKAQIVYFSHGGGPLPLLGDPGHKKMIDFMIALPSKLKKPDLILVISAHWEEKEATLLGAKNPPMFYDYYGFPEAAYRIKYPAPGSPENAERIARIIEQEHIPTRIDVQRGFDHGVFIPLKMMYPEADIPCLQLSLLRGLDASAHIKLGNSLRSLLKENILVIGSGFSFHNIQAFSWGGESREDLANEAFQDWLIDVCTGDHTQEQREQKLKDWKNAPSARYCHPREEHLLPVHVCQGLANKPASLVFNDKILGKRGVGFLW